MGRGVSGLVPRAVLELDLREPCVGGVQYELTVIRGYVVHLKIMHSQAEAVLSAASLTLPVVLALAGWTVFSLPY